jgi:hypothetical protein
MQKARSVKSIIYKVLATKDGITKDYGVQAYESTLDYALTLVAEKLQIDIDNVKLATRGYFREELQKFWKEPRLLLIRERETVNEQDAINYKRGEQAQSDLNALLKHEPLKTISEGNLYIVKDIDGERAVSDEMRFRPFYTTVGGGLGEEPVRVTPSKKPRVKANRAFQTDTNDMIYDDPDTILLPNTDFIVPTSVKGKTDSESLNSVFRFPSLKDSYEHVRKQIIDAGIADIPYRLNNNLTHLEACDSWLCGTGIKMGNKEASIEAVSQYIVDMGKVKENGKLKYPKFKSKKK